MKIAVISGSSRPDRNSHKVALAAIEKLKKIDDLELELIDIREHNLPMLENPINDQANPDEKLKNLSRILTEQDALLIVTPEHNGSYSGALKNTLDHFAPEYKRKAIGIVGVSTGMLGGVLAARELQLWALKINAVPTPQYLITPKVNSLFDENDNLIDATYSKLMDRYLKEFLWFAEALTEARKK